MRTVVQLAVAQEERRHREERRLDRERVRGKLFLLLVSVFQPRKCSRSTSVSTIPDQFQKGLLRNRCFELASSTMPWTHLQQSWLYDGKEPWPWIVESYDTTRRFAIMTTLVRPGLESIIVTNS